MLAIVFIDVFIENSAETESNYNWTMNNSASTGTLVKKKHNYN